MQLSLFGGVPAAAEDGSGAAGPEAEGAAEGGTVGDGGAEEEGRLSRIAKALSRPSAPPAPARADDALRRAIEAVDVDHLTPMQALERLAELKRKAQE
jgi:hypothetical protein